MADWDFEASEPGQVSIKAGEVVLIEDEQGDGWCTVTKKDGGVGFVPTAFLNKDKGTKKGTLFGRKKGADGPAPPIPSFGSGGGGGGAGGKKKEGTRRFASRRGETLGDVGARYTEQDAKETKSSGESSGGSSNNLLGASTGSVGSGLSPGLRRPSANVVSLPPSTPQTPLQPVKTGGAATTAATPAPAANAPTTTGTRTVGKLKNNPFEKQIAPHEDKGPAVKHKSPTAAPKVLVPQLSSEELAQINVRRTHIFREICETEKSYLRSIKEIVERYQNPMKDTKWSAAAPRLFSNIAMLVPTNEELLGNLLKVLDSWDPNTSLVGPLFLRMAPFLRLYNTYGNSYNDAVAALTSMSSDQKFVAFLETCKGDQPLTLDALLIQPVQRIPRYRLLLEDLVKNTPPRHPDHEALVTSLEAIREVATAVNESIRASESAKKVADVEGLRKYILPHRRLLMDLEAMATLDGDKKAKPVEVALYLFSDFLVLLFAKSVKTKDPRKNDFTELGWPATILCCVRESDTSFRVVGPGGVSITVTSREKDASTATSLVEPFYARLAAIVEECTNKIEPGKQGPRDKYPRRTPPKDGTKHGEYKFTEGFFYSGEWKDGLFHGQGVLECPGGLLVEGFFAGGEKDGLCRITYPTGEVYEGTCVKGSQHGNGRITWPNGDLFEGYWLDGRRDGEGTFVSACYKYTGAWQDGFMEGEGRLVFNGGGSYSGKFFQGKFHGPGVLLRCNGVLTKGVWNNGVLEGDAEEHYPESSPFLNYVGKFKEERRDGIGKMKYRDGSEYVGDWKRGERHGSGLLTAPARPIMRYEGQWAADKFEGKGEVRFQCLDQYVGSFSAGLMHGTGTYTYSNGVKILGEWKGGIRQAKRLTMSAVPGEWPEVELTGTKNREIAEAKFGTLSQTYFVNPARPDIDSALLEYEILPETVANMVTGTGEVPKIAAPGASGDASSDTPTNERKQRSFSTWSRKKDK